MNATEPSGNQMPSGFFWTMLAVVFVACGYAIMAITDIADSSRINTGDKWLIAIILLCVLMIFHGLIFMYTVVKHLVEIKNAVTKKKHH
jgi:uncharacterized membrane protein